MQTVFDVVDLLQLQEIWVRLPITQAFSRLERRQTAFASPVQFSLKWLLPRLGQLRTSMVWRVGQQDKSLDPALVPMCALTDPILAMLFPNWERPSTARKHLFVSTYNHFVASRYQGDSAETCALLRALADTRAAVDCLDEANLPLEGSNYWIPADLTDEIRSLDSRYESTMPDTPATFVVAESFWPLLVKASADEAMAAVIKYCSAANDGCVDESEKRLYRLIDLARDWNRTSSVVGLYYQVQDEDGEAGD